MADNDKCAHEFHEVAPGHKHEHSEDCSHIMIRHAFDHEDFVHDGELHHAHPEAKPPHWHKCIIPVSDEYPSGCTKEEFQAVACEFHEDEAVCGKGCGHDETVPHGDENGVHQDHLVPVGDTGIMELHHPHGDHCDVHGWVLAFPPNPSP